MVALINTIKKRSKEGNASVGIVNLTKFFSNERSGLIYMKYQLVPASTSMYDDFLYVEYFDSLAAAQGPFTTNKITYSRSYQN
ncbi:MAG: hypothetical protein ACTSRS_04820 [Candidatus Helarchaeota archaeon]